MTTSGSIAGRRRPSLGARGWALSPALAALLAGGCPRAPSLRPGEVARLGVIAPSSGHAARVGRRVRWGAALAASWPGPRLAPVSLTHRDTGGTASRAAAAVEALAADPRVVAGVGPVLGRAARAAARRASAEGLPLLTLSAGAGAADAGAGVFRVFLTVGAQARRLAEHAVRRLAIRRFAILRPRSSYGRAMAAAFTGAVERLGGRVVTTVLYRTRRPSFARAARRLRRHRYRGLLLPDGYRRVALAVGYLAAAGIPIGAGQGRRGVVLLGTNEWHHRDLLLRAGHHLEGAQLVAGFSPHASPVAERFARAYRRRHRKAPTYVDAYAFDAVLLARRALARAGAPRRDRVAAALREVGVEAATGRVRFDREGALRGSLRILEVRGRRFVPVE